jgi:hypothetical protein
MPRELFDPETPFEVVESELPGVDDPDPEVVYTVRSIDDRTYNGILDKHTPPARFNKQTHQKEEQPADMQAVYDDCVDYLLMDWRGVVSKGAPVACERANKLRLDNVVRTALFKVARLNRKAEQRADSFRAAS